MEFYLNNSPHKSPLTLDKLPADLLQFKHSLINLFDLSSLSPSDLILYFIDEENDKIVLSEENDYISLKEEKQKKIIINFDEKLLKNLQNSKNKQNYMPIFFENPENWPALEPIITEILRKNLKEIHPLISSKIAAIYSEISVKETFEKATQTSIFFPNIENSSQTDDILIETSKKFNLELISQKFPIKITTSESFIPTRLSFRNSSKITIPSAVLAIKIAEKYMIKGENVDFGEFLPGEIKEILYNIKNPGGEGRYGGYFEVFEKKNSKILKEFSFEFEVKENEVSFEFSRKTVENAKKLQEFFALKEEDFKRFLVFFEKNPKVEIEEAVNRYIEGGI